MIASTVSLTGAAGALARGRVADRAGAAPGVARAAGAAPRHAPVPCLGGGDFVKFKLFLNTKLI